MKDNGPSNIFDEASHSRPKKKPLLQKSVPPTSDQDMNLMLKKVEKYRNEIVEKLDGLQKKLGMTSKDIREYLRNPANFKPFEWDIVEKQRAIMEDQLLKLMGTQEVKKRESQKISKERRGKTLGSRKKWIPIK